jgi:hypothetical protein
MVLLYNEYNNYVTKLTFCELLMYLMSIHFSVVEDYKYRYPMYHEFFLQLSVLICTCFSLKELHFYYNERLWQHLHIK